MNYALRNPDFSGFRWGGSWGEAQTRHVNEPAADLSGSFWRDYFCNIHFLNHFISELYSGFNLFQHEKQSFKLPSDVSAALGCIVLADSL
jgi:hypothetical protein